MGMRLLIIITFVLNFLHSQNNSKVSKKNKNIVQPTSSKHNQQNLNEETCQSSAQTYNSSTQQCEHKPLNPANPIEIIGLGVLFLVQFFAIPAGVGGGGVSTAMVLFFFGFTFNHSVAIGKWAIFAGSFVKQLMDLFQKSPIKGEDKQLIHYEMAMLFQPILLAGGVLGVAANLFFPEWILMICSTLVLLYLALLTLKKTIDTLEVETNYKVEDSMNSSRGDDTLEDTSNMGILESNVQGDSHVEEQQRKQADITEEDRSLLPFSRVVQIFVSFVLLIVQAILRGDQTQALFAGGFTYCQPASWVVLAVQLLLSGVIVTMAFDKILDDQDTVIRNGHPRPFTWTRMGFYRFSMVIFVTGVLSGALGLAGGLMIGPILIQMKMEPRISVATSNYMGMWIALATGVQQALLGKVQTDQVQVVSGVAAVSALLGNLSVNWALSYWRIQSPLVIILTVILFLALLTMPLLTYFKLAALSSEGQSMWGFALACGA